MTIAIKPTASGSTIEQDGSTILTVDGSGNITPSNQLYPKVPAFSAYQSSSQTLSTSTNTKIQYQTERFDTNSNYDNVTNYRFTPTVEGYYQVNASLGVGASATGVYTQIFKNGSLYEGSYDGGHATITSTVSSLVYLNGTTDYIEIYGNFGSGQVTAASSSQTWFNAALVSV
jgi:hypothetical protein